MSQWKDDFQYAKTNILRSLDNAWVFASYLPDDEAKFKVGENIMCFKEAVEEYLNKIENEEN